MIEDVLRATIRTILEHADAYHGWTLQGLGMLRLRFDKTHRLHVWSEPHRVPNVTAIHDHPWNLISHVISGEIENILYRTVDAEEGNSEIRDRAEEYYEQEIVCGPGGCTTDPPERVYLYEYDRVTFLAGQDYAQRWFEIHESRPSDGAVSLIETRTERRFNGDIARVYFKPGHVWVSAEPRHATVEEIRLITRKALDRWS